MAIMNALHENSDDDREWMHDADGDNDDDEDEDNDDSFFARQTYVFTWTTFDLDELPDDS